VPDRPAEAEQVALKERRLEPLPAVRPQPLHEHDRALLQRALAQAHFLELRREILQRRRRDLGALLGEACRRELGGSAVERPHYPGFDGSEPEIFVSSGILDDETL